MQDASFFADFSLQRPGKKPGWIDTVIAVRFSCFGDLFTTWSHCASEQLPAPIVDQIVAAVREAAFIYVPPEALEQPYSGAHPGFAGGTWWYRFFDYS